MQLEETLWELQIPGTVSLYQDFLYSDSCVQTCQTTHLVKPVVGEEKVNLSGMLCQISPDNVV